MDTKEFCPRQYLDWLQEAKNQRNLSDEEAIKFVDGFIDVCWLLENLQDECFSRLVDIVLHTSPAHYAKLVVYLEQKSINFPKFLLLAKRLLEDVAPEVRQTMKIPVIGWSKTDDHTFISEAEFLWRKKHDLPCSQQENGAFTRPMTPSDLEYFYVSMELSFKTGGEAFFYIH